MLHEELLHAVGLLVAELDLQANAALGDHLVELEANAQDIVGVQYALLGLELVVGAVVPGERGQLDESGAEARLGLAQEEQQRVVQVLNARHNAVEVGLRLVNVALDTFAAVDSQVVKDGRLNGDQVVDALFNERQTLATLGFFQRWVIAI